MIDAQSAREMAESAIRTRRAKILKVVDSAIQDAAARGEMTTTIEEPRDIQVMDTLANLGFTVAYFEDDDCYSVSW